jgi:Xaa-Pro dipeptidase
MYRANKKKEEQMKFRVFSILIAAIFTVSYSNAQSAVVTAKEGSEILHLIRKEKLDLILPSAMRDNNVDMWIHVTRNGDPDPMAPHFGRTSGYLIFTDRGGDRIERAVFGRGGHPDYIDIYGSREIARAIEGYHYGKQDPHVYDELREFVEERDPKTIAVNTSDWLAIADGISHTQYVKLTKILGPKYSERIVSAENVITDFRASRTLREVVAMSNALEIHRQLLERALSNEVITPGVTTLGDVGLWLREQYHKRGLTRGYELGYGGPGVLYSATSKTRPRGGRDYVIQRGDFLSFDTGVRYLDYFSTDYKRNAYVMREGETSVPKSLQHAFDRAIAAREIIRKQIKVGNTAGETLKAIVSALEAADYIYTPFIDIGSEDYKMVQKALADTDNSGFSIDLHSLGNNGGSLVTVGPSVAPFRSDRDHLIIRENHFFAFEYMVHTNLPERPGYPISINVEGNHIVGNRGVEFLHPPNERILLIH